MATPQESIQNLHYRIIRYFSQSIFRRNTLEDILWDIVSNCIRELEFEDCVIYLVDRERQVLIQKAAYGPKNIDNAEILTPMEIPFGRGISGNVAMTGIPEMVDDVTRDDRYILDDIQRMSEIAVPIIYEGQVFGVIDSEHSERGFYKPHHIDILESIASICSSKIAHFSAEEEVEELARFFEENPSPVLRISAKGKLLQHNHASEGLLKHWGINDVFDPHSFIMEHVSRSLAQKEVVSVQSTIEGRAYSIRFAPVISRRYCNIFINDVTEIEKAKQEAERANKAKDEFLSIVSHEMRTPVNAILGISNLLKGSDLDEEQLEYLNNLDFSSKNLLNLINDVLDFAKIQANKVVLEHVPFHFTQLLQSTVSSFKGKAQEQNIELNLVTSSGLPEMVIGDELRLIQILNNLLNNALKFTEKGEVTCRAMLVNTDDQKSRIRFEVEDTGIGISSEAMNRIFAPFEQANTSTTRRFGGTGLGLSICHKLVELYGGKLCVDSTEGEGTTFCFELEFENHQSPQHKVSLKMEDLDLTGKTFLVVDDNEINLLICQEFLKRWGGMTVTAMDGLDAVRQFEQTKVDLILMDLQMPECDGLEATRRIRAISSADENSPDYVPVVLVTADVLYNQQEDSEMQVIDDYLTKPFNPEDLYSKVRTLLDARN